MNNSVKIIFTFTLGAAIGVVASQQYFKKKYENIAQEEIDSVKDVYSKKHAEEVVIEHKEEKKRTCDTIGELDAYKDAIHDLGYTNKKGGSEPVKKNMIEVVPPDEFGYDGDYDEYSDYDCIGFTYYNNDILTDDGDFPIDDPEEIVGPDALDSFGEWEDDRVCVRNDDRKCYYEILRDLDNYSGPQVEDE